MQDFWEKRGGRSERTLSFDVTIACNVLKNQSGPRTELRRTPDLQRREDGETVGVYLMAS